MACPELQQQPEPKLRRGPKGRLATAVIPLCFLLSACDSNAPSLSLIIDNPQLMKDRDGVQIRKWFGKPDFVRKDGKSELWRYVAGKCSLELFMFRDGGVATPSKVSHYEMRPRGGEELTDRLCLAEIALSRK